MDYAKEMSEIMRLGKKVEEDWQEGNPEIFDKKVSIIRVKTLEEVRRLLEDVANMLFVLDFSGLTAEQEQRAVDILSGALFVKGGTLKQVVPSVCVSVPDRALLYEEMKLEEAVYY